MIEDIPSLEKRFTPDPDYYKFLKKMLVWKILINGFIIWLFYFYLIPALMAEGGQFTPIQIIMATFGSLVINYAIIFLFAYPFYSWQYKLMIENHWWALGETIIFVHRGFLSLDLARIPYKRIQNLNTKKTFWDRQGGYERIEIQTAGRGGVIAEGVLFGIKNAEEMIKMIAPYINTNIPDSALGSGEEEIDYNLDKTSIMEEKILASLNNIQSTLNSIEKILKNK